MSGDVTSTYGSQDRTGSKINHFQAETFVVQLFRGLRIPNGKGLRINKWRTDPQLTVQNTRFEGVIARGGFGFVFKAINTATNVHYAVKVQEISDNVWAVSPDNIRQTGDDDGSSHTSNRTPQISPSSQAEFRAQPELSALSLRAKRFGETNLYLRYIKSGHPNICMLEAFVDYEERIIGEQDRLLMMAQYYEIADAGTVADLLQGLVNRDSHPPELFLWHLYSQLFEALAFLHNEHPDYNTRPEHINRPCIIHSDLHGSNVFLQWGANRDQYPNVKIGDFGISHCIPPGGYVRNYANHKANDWAWPESHDGRLTVKTDVWMGGCIVYMLANSGSVPKPYRDPYWPERLNLEEITREAAYAAKNDPRRVRNICSHYSADLNNSIKRCLTINKNERPTSGTMMREVKRMTDRRRKYMYRRLPAWVGRGRVAYEFPDGRIDELVEPGALEAEAERIKKEEADARALENKEENEFLAREDARYAERERRRKAGESYSPDTEFDSDDNPQPKTKPRIAATGIPIPDSPATVQAARLAERERRRRAGESYSPETEVDDDGNVLPKGPRIAATGIPIGFFF